MLVAMYYPQRPREPSGCLETLVITRLIIAMLLVPLLLIVVAVIAVIVAFYALTIHPLLALLTILTFAGALIGVVHWESRRIAREAPPED